MKVILKLGIGIILLIIGVFIGKYYEFGINDKSNEFQYKNVYDVAEINKLLEKHSDFPKKSNDVLIKKISYPGGPIGIEKEATFRTTIKEIDQDTYIVIFIKDWHYKTYQSSVWIYEIKKGKTKKIFESDVLPAMR